MWRISALIPSTVNMSPLLLRKFKERVLSHASKGHTQEATAKLFGIGETTLKEWKRRSKANESLEPKIRKRPPKKLPPDELRAFV